MRLLKSEGKLELLKSSEAETPTGYAILSHRWLDPEVSYEDITSLPRDLKSACAGTNDRDAEYRVLSQEWSAAGYAFGDQNMAEQQRSSREQSVEKLKRFRNAAASHKYKYIWLDTCCIDQKNPVELTRAINSMYRWYAEAERCFVYLYDYDLKDKPRDLTVSKWFTRGWTLQELIAPKAVEFFDKNWERIGLIAKGQETRSDKDEKLLEKVVSRTGIDREVLLHQRLVSSVSIARRMSWFCDRETTEPEDSAYCLLGLFEVSMPTIPGEGLASAFRRLQEEIMKNSDDHSLFAWKLPMSISAATSGLLAPSPQCFAGSGHFVHLPNSNNPNPFQMTNKGLSIDIYLLQLQDGTFVATLDCTDGSDARLSIFLKRSSSTVQQFSRIRSHETCNIRRAGPLKRVYVLQPLLA